VLHGELIFGISIGIDKKVGDEVHRGIGIGDGDVVDEPLVPVCANFCSEVSCIWGDCTSGVEEGRLIATVGDDG